MQILLLLLNNVKQTCCPLWQTTNSRDSLVTATADRTCILKQSGRLDDVSANLSSIPSIVQSSINGSLRILSCTSTMHEDIHTALYLYNIPIHLHPMRNIVQNASLNRPGWVPRRPLPAETTFFFGLIGELYDSWVSQFHVREGRAMCLARVYGSSGL